MCAPVCCSVLLCAAVCSSVLQCAPVCCSVLQCAAVCCSVLQCAAVCCSVLQCAAVWCVCSMLVCCSVLQCAAACCSVFQCAAMCLQCAAVCCSGLRCVAWISHVTRMNESCRTYIRMWMSNVTRKSSHTCRNVDMKLGTNEWVISHIYLGAYAVIYGYEVGYEWMSHFTHISRRVCSNIWIWSWLRMNESFHTYI